MLREIGDWVYDDGPVWDRVPKKRGAHKRNAGRSSLFAILGPHAVTATYSTRGGRATRVRRSPFGGFNSLLWLRSEANAVPNRATSHELLTN